MSDLNFATSPINQSLTPERKIELFTQMVRIRRFEQAAAKSYAAGEMGGFLHLYIGQESVAVGTISLGGADDHYITAYRDHGHALAVGMGMNECMAEMYGKQTGCSKGKGGSMHFFAPDKNFWGGHGIVAGQTPLGLGLAFALKYQGKDGCCLCYLGDGAVNQGAFHESLNIASLFGIPVIYVIENNGYSMGTSQERSSAYTGCLAQRAEAYAIEWDVVNGSDIYEVRAKTQIAMDRAKKESKPTVLEIDTYRYYGHSVADANHKKYRTPEEIQNYKDNYDPINVFRRKLIDEGVLTEEKSDEIGKAAQEEAVASVKFAKEAPAPTIPDISTDVYWETDNNTEASKIGHHFFA
ncbi:MAG: pyruvate dehydrogenase (acetyl-transferring) E1 component subunit alpha [Akkermansiaceae bacterium]|jgi:pyruvate dehydrogenase E1 component alpha subunit|nr:pyruvate dehydrogenase (acetyl-transferring) E1 component subunit alpha [Akkermansiaceae bacterium]MDP4721027.1 pyruvate dehydrogenase (acetyl-transferring) E1 component subunit alpha [Akkermansiaceae bacterium]MDP4779380.1 pyruvate dehydrogenase (acetyl-transferring) E1 component subunit alpha [Akkermansiaceae bacterium]MDP4848355.1 pyruvate dehydrogenase (acetyl-transferring) E1 component subunit alpha [Akkermansiaceae bacterium]MDP4897661.1 pyruvate dehydrogenase (acetyl-transferring) E1 